MDLNGESRYMYDYSNKNLNLEKLNISNQQENEDYLYLGKHYRIHKVTSKSNKVFIENDLLVVYTNCLEIEKIQKLVNDWLG